MGKIKNDTETFQRFLHSVNWQTHHLLLIGDVFDIWSLTPRLLTTKQKGLLSQFARIRQRFQTEVILCRGNRDLLADNDRKNHLPFDLIIHNGQFLQLSPDSLFFAVHGDLINTDDTNHQRLNRLLHSGLHRFLAATVPTAFYYRCMNRIERSAKEANQNYKKYFPEKRFRHYLHSIAANYPAPKISRPQQPFQLFCGHFHPETRLEYSAAGVVAHVLKPWFLDQTYYVFSMDGVLREETFPHTAA